jgi:hypothetical protein
MGHIRMCILVRYIVQTVRCTKKHDQSIAQTKKKQKLIVRVSSSSSKSFFLVVSRPKHALIIGQFQQEKSMDMLFNYMKRSNTSLLNIVNLFVVITEGGIEGNHPLPSLLPL